MRVERQLVLAEDFCVDVGGVRDTQWIVRVNRQHPGLGTDKLIEIINVASDDVLFVVFSEQERFDHSQPIGDVLGATIRPGLVFKGNFIEKGVGEFLRDGRRHHLLPDAVMPLAGFRG